MNVITKRANPLQDIQEHANATRQEIRESLELVRRGLVKPVLLNTFRLEQANKAHQLIDEMKLIGRTALIISE
jgi:D-arabinose 1-dehydrogenase-like Zn-dependent alcohol dehydrogenase